METQTNEPLEEDVSTHAPGTLQGHAIETLPARPIVTLHFSDKPSQGLCGNFNGWRSLWIYSQISEISQWMTARLDLAEEVEPPGELNLLDVEGQSYIVRLFQSGKVMAYGQLAIDRRLSPEMTARKHAWAEAIVQRTRRVETRNLSRSQEAVVEHTCTFCNEAIEDDTSPSWLYDRLQRKTILVSEELAGACPPYEVLSYTWGRAAGNEWQQVAGIPWRVRLSVGLPVSRIFDLLESFTERYIWIDIFCIPQDCPSAKAREIARQAQIFRRAKGGIAWLHQTASVWPLIIGLLSWSISLRKQFLAENPVPVPPPYGTFAALEELVSDPWFSSTWALQEAILRPNLSMVGVAEWTSALFFPDGSLANAAHVQGRITIEEFRSYLNQVRAIASDTIKCQLNREWIKSTGHLLMRPKDALTMERLLQDTGLLGMATPTPGSIMSGLTGRTSVKAHDKFYGIQSVFNMTMQGDYTRSLEDVQGEFLAHVWTGYAPILSLALNRPVIGSGSGQFRSDTEDSLLWFSYAQINEGLMSCTPPGSSTVSALLNAEGLISLADSDSIREEGKLWRYEAIGPPAAHSKIASILYGLPPILVDISHSTHMEQFYKPQVLRWWHRIPVIRTIATWWQYLQDRRGTASFMDRTSRLMYVGKLLNENGHLGMRRSLYVYMEYFLKRPGVGHRVGAMVSDLPFKHHRVEGPLAID